MATVLPLVELVLPDVVLLVVVVVVVFAVVVLPAVWASALADRIGKVGLLAGSPAGMDARSKIYSRDGKLLAILHGEENREPISLERLVERGAARARFNQAGFFRENLKRTFANRAKTCNANMEWF